MSRDESPLSPGSGVSRHDARTAKPSIYASGLAGDLALLADLSGGFTQAASSRDVAVLATRQVARHLGLSRCLLVEIDEAQEHATVFHDQVDAGQASLVGTYRIADFHTPEERHALANGHCVAIDDVAVAPRESEAAARFQALRIGSLVNAPYSSDGRLKFLLSAVHDEPHAWRASETALLQELATRIYLRLERARAEEALRAAHDTFRHLVAHSPFGVYAVDADFRLVQVSAGAQKVFETVRPLLGRDFAEVMRLLWPEPFATDAIGRFRHTLETGEAYHSPSMVERRQDIGSVESYDWKTERVILPDGRPGVVCHFYNLSERQRYEAALRDADRQKDEFLAMLAHELRNPLAPIRSASGALRARGLLDPVVMACSETIDRQTSQMARLLDDLLDVSRLSRGRLTLQRASVLLDDVLAAAVETSRPLLDEQHQQLEVAVETPGLVLDADAARLTQVFANLLNNASRFSPRGSHIALRAARDGDTAVVRVRDVGKGIEPGMLERIFELFTQGDADESAGRGGLGIGLSLARRLVELHGGHIAAASEGAGHGSEFSVTLLLAPHEQPTETLLAEGPAPASLAGRRVLIVDDNVDAADMTALLLGALGCEVHAAYDGTTGLQEALTRRPDVMLLDLGLPDVDGYEVARRVRGSAWGRGVRLIAVSGWGRDEDRQRSSEAGFDHHFTKPVAPEALIAVLRVGDAQG